MSKRRIHVAAETSAKTPKHWSLGLVEDMKDPAKIIKKTDHIVVIKDKYPKAKIHYLVLPKENISCVNELNRSHVTLLEEFGKIFEDLKMEHKGCNLRAGFHALPHMQRLHMHVISTDMISPCLKREKHWINFTTKAFLPYQDVLYQLKEKGFIEKLSPEEHKRLLSSPLICNQCSYRTRNLLKLKEHLLTHNK